MKRICIFFGLFFSLILSGINPVLAQGYFLQQDEFGTTELISCTDALRTRAPLYLGLEITPKENWQVQLENLTLSTSTPIPVNWFTPFEQPDMDHLVFPISAVLTEKPTESISFRAEGNIRACSQGNCTVYPFSLIKTLDTKRAFITADCERISHALTYTPIPAYMDKVKGWAIPQTDQSIQVTLDFPQAPRTIQVFTRDKQPLSLDILVNEKRVQFSWPTQDEDLNLFVRTYYGYYEIKLPILPKETTIPMQGITLWKILQVALLFFLLSAFPIFWARSTDVPHKTFLKQTKQTLFFILLLGIAISIAICIKGPLNLSFIHINKYWILILMALAVIFTPAHVCMPFLFTFLIPHPYLSFIQSTSEQLTFVILTTGITATTFALQWFWSKKIFKKLQAPETTSYIWWCCRIPWIFWMFYILLYL